MQKWVMLVVAVATGMQLVAAQEFGDLPQGNYSADTVVLDTGGGLGHLFVMARQFVDVVFKPFSEFAVFLQDVIKAQDPIQYISNNWQNPLAGYLYLGYKAASFDAGYIACLVFGLLFIVFVPLIGSFMCCCRCCCNNCGGRLKQSGKRGKSCWRQCLCVSMLILTTFMAIPTVFVFLTNEWMTQVVVKFPAKTEAILDDIVTYTKLIPTQIDFVSDQYGVVDKNIRVLVEDFGVTVGQPLQEEVETMLVGSMQALDETIAVVDDVTRAINDVDTSLQTLQIGMARLSGNLSEVQTGLTTAVSGCVDAACTAISGSTGSLATGFDVSDFDPLLAELQSVNSSLNDYDIAELKANITQEVDNIPQKTTEQTATISQDAIKTLDSTNETISEISEKIPTDSFASLESSISDVQLSINNGFETYNDSFDKYRYIAGLVLGSILAFVVFCYYLGMFLGVCGYARKISPTDRKAASNCGGIMLMVGVGFSFIFSWLLMILVVVTFTIGGHGERYVCQSMEKPYEGVVFLEENVPAVNFTQLLNLPVSVSLVDVLNSCENNMGAYQAFRLDYLFNISEFSQNVTQQTDSIENTVNNASASIDLSTIEIYTDESQQNIIELKNTPINSINFTYYLGQLGAGLTAENLTEYAEFLRTQADGITGAAVQNEIRGYATRIDDIQREDVEPLQDDYEKLNASINILVIEANNINATIDNLDQELLNLNTSIQTNGTVIIQDLTKDISDKVVGNITSYSDWVTVQISTNLAACQPIYSTYAGFVSLTCDYFIDTINGLWFSLGWCIFFLIPSAIVAMKLMKFFRRMDMTEEFEDSWDDMEMRDYATPASHKASDPFY